MSIVWNSVERTLRAFYGEDSMKDWYAGECAMGTCQGGVPARAMVRCGRHAARHAQHKMDAQGWICVNEYGMEAKPIGADWIKLLNAVYDAGLQLQHWMTGWDEARGFPKYGVWAPRLAAVIIGVAKDALDQEQLTTALRASREDPDFINAVDAAWRLGGDEGGREVILSKLPHVKLKPRP